jgi:hypothetical protein
MQADLLQANDWVLIRSNVDNRMTV